MNMCVIHAEAMQGRLLQTGLPDFDVCLSESTRKPLDTDCLALPYFCLVHFGQGNKVCISNKISAHAAVAELVVRLAQLQSIAFVSLEKKLEQMWPFVSSLLS